MENTDVDKMNLFGNKDNVGEKKINTAIKNTIIITDKEAQFDLSAKKLLSMKSILAWILKGTIEDYRDMNINDIISCIEGESIVNVVPVEPGLTNKADNSSKEKVVGFNTEDSEVNEGLVRYDIVFYVRTRDGSSKIIVNIEAQRVEPDYDILNRAIFYVSRLISSQKNRDFEKTNYNDIKQVYSIWICMNAGEDSLTHIHLTSDRLLGNAKWEGDLGLFNIIMLGLSMSGDVQEGYELHHLLNTLLSNTLSKEDKLSVIENEYNIVLDESQREDVGRMCNLGQAVKEEGRKEGREEGIVYVYFNEMKLSIPNIAKKLSITEKEVNDIINNMNNG